MKNLISLGLVMLVSSVLSQPAFAQSAESWDAGRLERTRTELEGLLKKYEQAENSTSFSSAFRQRARTEAELVRSRLRDGDFQVGDQVAMTVEGETGIPAVLTVAPGLMLTIPNFGELALVGTLRSELAGKLNEHFAQFIQKPSVQTRSLIRVAVMGQVARPGFYLLAAESIVSDAIMAAGGPLPTSNVSGAVVERGAVHIWEGQALQQAIVGGRTLDQMSLRSGDQLTIPTTAPGKGASVIRAATVVPAALLAIVGLVRMR